MVICFDVSPQAHAALEQLMASGRYRDLNTAVSTAICNQATLDRQVTASGGMVMPVAKRDDHVPDDPMPSAWLQQPVPPYDVTPLEAPFVSCTRPTDGVLGPKHWPWGQFNKLLPVKVTCRVVLNLLLKNPAINAEEAAEIVADTADEFGAKLRQADAAGRRRRDEAFAAAFPSADSGSEKSRLRFMEQFVFGTGSFAETSFPQVLGLVRLDGATVRLTPAGRAFGELANPLLDGNYLQAAEKFSADELTFLRTHIRSSVPSERHALTSVLRAIHDGASNPDAIDAYLRQLFAGTATELTPPFLATQRTGAISRAIELRLIRRDRHGVRVNYVLQEAGERFLES